MEVLSGFRIYGAATEPLVTSTVLETMHAIESVLAKQSLWRQWRLVELLLQLRSALEKHNCQRKVLIAATTSCQLVHNIKSILACCLSSCQAKQFLSPKIYQLF